MPPREYLFGATPRTELEGKKLDKHLAKYKKRYFGFAKGAMAQLKIAHDAPDRLEHGDLYSVLRDLMGLDGELIRALNKAGISEGRRAKWVSWFTWLLVYEYWDDKDDDDDD